MADYFMNPPGHFCYVCASIVVHRQVILENVPETVTEENIEKMFPGAFNIIIFGQEPSTKGYVCK